MMRLYRDSCSIECQLGSRHSALYLCNLRLAELRTAPILPQSWACHLNADLPIRHMSASDAKRCGFRLRIQWQVSHPLCGSLGRGCVKTSELQNSVGLHSIPNITAR